MTAEAGPAPTPGRVLVTGASGFVGYHVAERLVRAGRPVRCLVRRTSSRSRLAPLGVELAEGDVAGGAGPGGGQALVDACAGCEAVVHSAGITNAVHPADYFRVNAEGTLRLWMAAEAAGVRRFLLVSSLAAAGPSPGDIPQDETVEPHPINAYGRSKLEAERVVLGVGGPVAAVVVRPPAVYGPGDAAILTLVRAARRGWFPRVGKAARRLSLVHGADLAEGILLALERGAAGRVYYLTDGDVHDLWEVALAMAAALGRGVRPLPLPRAALWLGALGGEVAAALTRRPALLNLDRVRQLTRDRWTASDARARLELGYRSRYDLAAGMEDTIRWYRSVRWI
jgi:nucleoside-diphosphate-sugar epimerase